MQSINKNYRKYFYFLFILLLFTPIFTLIAGEEEAAASTVSSSTSIPQVSYSLTGSKTVNSTVTIAINISNASQIYGGSLDLVLDKSILEVQEIKMGTLFAKNINKPLINRTDNSGVTSILMTLSGANNNLSTTSGSLVTITAKIKKEGTINFSTTNTLSNLSLGKSTSCIKLSGAGGVKLNYSYNNASYSFASALPLAPGIHTNSDENLIYSGTWTKSGDSSQQYSNSKDSSLTFSFNGTGFTVNSIKANNRGIAKVYIDNVEAGSFDDYSASPICAAVFTKNNLSQGNHIVRIIVTNSKNTASSGYYTSINSIDIFGSSLTAGEYSNNNLNLIYSGSWTKSGDSSQQYSNTKDSSLSFSFKGTGFNINSIKANNRGIARVYIDNVDCGTFDDYSANVISTSAFTKNNLPYGNHTVRIVVTNSKNSASSGYYISIKSINIFESLLSAGNYNNNDSSITYSGSWTKAADSSQQYSNVKDSSLSFSFKGTGFNINSIKANNRGIARVYVDDVDCGTFDDYSASVISTSAFTKNNLSYGNHTVKIVVTSSKNSASSGYYISIKSIDVLGSLLTPGNYSNTNSNIIYSGSWTKAGDSSQQYSNSKDSTLSFSFKGTGFTINSIKANNRGIAKVYIDNIDYGTFDDYSASITTGAVFSKSNLNSGTHDVKVVVTNSKNQASSGYYISIKSIDILN